MKYLKIALLICFILATQAQEDVTTKTDTSNEITDSVVTSKSIVTEKTPELESKTNSSLKKVEKTEKIVETSSKTTTVKGNENFTTEKVNENVKTEKVIENTTTEKAVPCTNVTQTPAEEETCSKIKEHCINNEDCCDKLVCNFIHCAKCITSRNSCEEDTDCCPGLKCVNVTPKNNNDFFQSFFPIAEKFNPSKQCVKAASKKSSKSMASWDAFIPFKK